MNNNNNNNKMNNNYHKLHNKVPNKCSKNQ